MSAITSIVFVTTYLWMIVVGCVERDIAKITYSYKHDKHFVNGLSKSEGILDSRETWVEMHT